MALERLQPGEPLHGSVLEILRAAERSAALTRQLLAFARRQPVQPRVIDLGRRVEVLLEMLRRLVGEDIGLHFLPGADVRAVRIDPAHVDHILVNLCMNARDAIADVGRIMITTSNAVIDEAFCDSHRGVTPGAYVTLSVTDTGGGIPDDVREHLFEPFFTTKDLGQGTGLGLATVFGMASQNGGFLTFDSRVGTGSTFRVHFPAHDGAVQHLVPVPEEPGAPVRETVLLVEDEPALLALSKLMLERIGCRVFTATSPGDALRLSETTGEEIGLLVSDVVMPEMNGLELGRRLSEHRPRLKHLFVSGYTPDVIARHGCVAEGAQFLLKPFTRRELESAVRRALGEAAPAR
jgi:CheY-like chemotaxis protein